MAHHRLIDLIRPLAVVVSVGFAAALGGAIAARAAEDAPSARVEPTAEQVAALDEISADSLRGHLSFLASDLLEGRDTPSRGLDLAAEYIAAQFRRAGLEPIGDDGYFQTAKWRTAAPDVASFRGEVQHQGGRITLNPDQVSVPGLNPIEVVDAPAIKVDYRAPDALTLEQVQGKVVVAEGAAPERLPVGRRQEALAEINRFFSRMIELKPALIVQLDRDQARTAGANGRRLIDPEQETGRNGARRARPRFSVLKVHDPKLIELFDSLPADAASPRFTIHLNEPIEQQVKPRNVAGLLRGSDPTLKNSYVLLTAHYDHIGVQPTGTADSIYNGANDDGSGTVTVIEVASALARLKGRERPRRSLVFMTFFGEEKGLLGSRYYGSHPLVPIADTVADVNLEQVGRTDDSEGPQVGAASMTGIDFSTVGDVFQAAGKAEGVRVYKHPRRSDAFFSRSDNQALADQGVPAHTLTVAFEFPDYHGPHDHWDKIDYDNMAKISRLTARGLLMIANDPEAPRWSESNPKAAKYRDARKQRQESQ